MEPNHALWASFLRDEDGATAIEYALLAIMVGVVAIGALFYLGQVMQDTFDRVANTVDAAGS